MTAGKSAAAETITAALAVGATLEPVTCRIDRADLVRYAGASGDFNPIHWSERTARAVGLPTVLAHGMLLMALAARAVGRWTDAPLTSFDMRFVRPGFVPDDEVGLPIEIRGRVSERDAGRVRIVLTVHAAAGATLARAAAEVDEMPGAERGFA
ncbi:MaoC family dehydratase N-terminal domain-containing protein [Nocardia terpenica]|uniref:MaoC/PaaZ C-terminal domain-containing protein n=1 Tax=Nocardia terpenica TaxID=455432 RepID=UPI0018961EBF|nr:MaoC/PaaZ C-terminal domain-containing protein [Nocardia terpenica]MBF6064837.1 MaoC family dehydratase N-terminal domain-containing protein [Nocardia terpenica]MBF6107352.1 MaoC family dehydratase N-terminal domain-containing protein [Nocardia terpenica]MBF6115109.1 MaoC family dehydratase N-terminal domain-containing protein [Nocardia terpenica]MBF6122215.1 MaoC family dehydratase N-terminal domain-containing protein [Nocardia terpenica]MBF6154598.1 MaoC family dehydratase N-terminal doma